MTLQTIKSQLEILYKTNPDIHISVNFTSPKLFLENEKATIKGVYNHILQVEEDSAGFARKHSIQLTDIATGRVKIKEME